MTMDAAHLVEHIAGWMAHYLTEQGKSGFVVGVSGGVDSALTGALAARTGHPTLCITMPIEQAADELQRARAHLMALQANYAHVETLELPLDPVLATMREGFGAVPWSATQELAWANTKSRIRLAALYYHATVRNALVLGTGNKVEQRGVGFFAKYGDGGMDLSPLGALSKSQVYELACAAGVHQAILKAPPTDGLWADGRTDLEQIGASYPELEWAMDLRESQATVNEEALSVRQREVLRIYDKRHNDSRHKIVEAPQCPLPRGVHWPVRNG